jgi:xanthine dehydrogenase small subunit
VSSFFESPLVRREFLGIERYETAFASTLIRNLATVGGNIVNASPVGDILSMLMALGARLVLVPAPLAAAGHTTAPGTEERILAQARIIPIEAFFLAYKKIDLRPDEILAAIRLPLIADDRKFSFEKISKRKNLDIAAVNTAIFFTLEKGRFRNVRISLGGVAPVPKLSMEAMAVLEGAPCPQNDAASLASFARRCAETAAASVSPIDDVRGSAEYRRRMVRQLMLGHFIRLFESTGIAEELFP